MATISLFVCVYVRVFVSNPLSVPTVASKLPKSVASSFNVQTFLEKHWKWELYRYLWFMVIISLYWVCAFLLFIANC